MNELMNESRHNEIKQSKYISSIKIVYEQEKQKNEIRIYIYIKKI